jgi:hypothetical protein
VIDLSYYKNRKSHINVYIDGTVHKFTAFTLSTGMILVITDKYYPPTMYEYVNDIVKTYLGDSFHPL